MSASRSGELVVEHVLTMDEHDRVLSPGLLTWEDGILVEVRPASAVESRRVEAGVAMPGLINTHHHLASSILTGLEPEDSVRLHGHAAADRRALAAAFDGELTAAACELGYRELVAAGTTTTTDGIAAWRTDDRVDGALEAAARSSLRVQLSVAFLDRTELIPPTAQYGPAAALAEIDRLRSANPNTRVTIEGEPLSLPRCSDELIVALHGHRQHRMSMHLTYSGAFDRWARQTLGHPAIHHLEALGILDHAWLFAHPIHLDHHELALLGDARPGVAYCPSSNHTMGLATLDVARLHAHGLRVGIGIDHPNGHHEPLGEARAALLAQRAATGDGVVPSPLDVARWATVDGARVLGLDGLIGRLAPRMAADIAVFDGLPLARGSAEEIADLLVLGHHGRRAERVIADGRDVVAGGRVLAASAADPRQVRRRLLHRAGLS